MIESRKYDCSRGCVVQRADTGELDCTYRQGCCKLEVYDWLHGISQEQYNDYFEVRFKNTRKGIYVNASGQSIKTGDLVIVEAANGHDLGIVTLEGPIVAHQMKCKRINPETFEFKKIYRKAKLFDIEKWQEAIAREHEVMIRSRQIAAELGLEMKIGDVEFQGDGTKAIFYYIADGRVDFRQLIKVFAEEFRIRIEMKQIGARQEAGLIGGLGVCGRELCCASWISSFSSVTTGAARVQDLSLNPLKLAGQCSKLKCCLMYEYDLYMDARRAIPRIKEPLQAMDGEYYLVKTDILAKMMTFSSSKESMSNMVTIPVWRVKEILAANRNGEKVENIAGDSAPAKNEEPTYRTEEDSITRFDKSKKRKKKRNNKPAQGRGPKSQQEATEPQSEQTPAQTPQEPKPQQEPKSQQGQDGDTTTHNQRGEHHDRNNRGERHDRGDRRFGNRNRNHRSGNRRPNNGEAKPEGKKESKE